MISDWGLSQHNIDIDYHAVRPGATIVSSIERMPIHQQQASRPIECGSVQ
jgi:hypothetical protein